MHRGDQKSPKTTYSAASSPDKGSAIPRTFREMFFTGGVMGLRPTQGNEKRFGPASVVYGTVTLSLSSRPKRTRISCHAVLDKAACAPFS